MVPKPTGFYFALPCQLAADRLAAAAGLMLALHWPLDPGFWTLAAWTLVPSDVCHSRHWSLSALVTVARDGARTPLNQPNDLTLDETAGS